MSACAIPIPLHNVPVEIIQEILVNAIHQSKALNKSTTTSAITPNRSVNRHPYAVRAALRSVCKTWHHRGPSGRRNTLMLPPHPGRPWSYVHLLIHYISSDRYQCPLSRRLNTLKREQARRRVVLVFKTQQLARPPPLHPHLHHPLKSLHRLNPASFQPSLLPTSREQAQAAAPTPTRPPPPRPSRPPHTAPIPTPNGPPRPTSPAPPSAVRNPHLHPTYTPAGPQTVHTRNSSLPRRNTTPTTPQVHMPPQYPSPPHPSHPAPPSNSPSTSAYPPSSATSAYPPSSTTSAYPSFTTSHYSQYSSLGTSISTSAGASASYSPRGGGSFPFPSSSRETTPEGPPPIRIKLRRRAGLRLEGMVSFFLYILTPSLFLSSHPLFSHLLLFFHLLYPVSAIFIIFIAILFALAAPRLITPNLYVDPAYATLLDLDTDEADYVNGPFRTVKIEVSGTKDGKLVYELDIPKSMIKYDAPMPRSPYDPHPCILCGQVFVSERHMNRHMLTHTDIKPYTCDKCTKPFAPPDSMVRHRRNVHGINELSPRSGTLALSGEGPGVEVELGADGEEEEGEEEVDELEGDL
ncbi:hypothetical protein M422DRAFT_239351 [Sphaerobolus stellatus SS14]|nr:hypothetical protein M422DRAFT_239351 [Sphaerobolus stellatus SS14]